ncbi:S-adenosyl-L-methionine-dependent methyltransferase [Acephala macrosclerotiorum]|nr:S-adenosyl-L-methionine-dependent methyltransferase [Acephala macrosclerotiorum]
MASRRSPLKAYAEHITCAVETVDSYCRENNLLDATVDSDQNISIHLPPSAPQNVLVARQTIIDSALKLQQLAVGPNEYLPYMAVQYQYLACIRWLCHFSIPSHLPVQGSVPYTEIANAAKVPELQLRRISRMAITSGFLSEPSPGMLAHSSTSAPFANQQGLVDWALLLAELSAPTAQKMVEVTERYGGTSKKNETAFNIQHNTDLPYFDYFGQLPMLRARFASYMKTVGSFPGTNIKHLIHGFDWASLGEATVVDVGGSSGHASIALANAYPQLKFIVQDLPETISNAPPLSEALSCRITFMNHSFFEPQVIKDADVYLLRMILHDWPDVEAVRILQNHVQVLRTRKARLVIMDTVLPTPGSVPSSEESLLRYRDLTMMQMFNSKERDLSDWMALCERLNVEDGRLILKNVEKPFGSVMSVMEIAYSPVVVSNGTR